MSRAWLARLVAPVLLSVLAAGLLLGFPLMVVVALAGGSAGGTTVPGAVSGIHPVLLDAYSRAAAAAAPDCPGMRWSVLAGVGQVESGHAQDRTISAAGDVTPPVIGPALDGSGVGGNLTPVYDTDDGRLDGDTVYDRAVGALQFLPSTWASLGRDGNGDGVKDPHNVYDVTVAAAAHLCGDGTSDLADPQQLQDALYGYNRSHSYVASVMQWITTYDQISLTDPAAGSERGAQIVAAAQRWLGTPYSWGGGDASGPTLGFGPGAHTVGFDCSGLTTFAYAAVGIRLPRVSADQFNTGTRIPRGEGLAALQPGDMVFFAANPEQGLGVHHVGIYTGGGQMINAPHTGAVVRIDAVWMDSYAGAVRHP